MVNKEYAKALFSLAKDNDCLKEINDNFNLFITSLNENVDYFKILTYPNIKINEKKNSIKEVYSSLNSLFVDFLYVLIDNNQMVIAKDIHNEFVKLMNEENKIKVIEVYSNKKLSKDDYSEIMNKLKGQKYFAGYDFEIENYVEESLIGGIRIICEGQLLDLTLDTKILNLKESI